MKAIDLVDVEPIEQPIFDHHPGPAAALLRGLENEYDVPIEIAVGR